MTQGGTIRILARAYLDAREAVEAAGFAEEIRWQETVDLAHISESAFLREAAWVVLSSGMREAVVRTCFPLVSEAFLSWSSANAINRRRKICRRKALEAFNHERKIDAILSIAAFSADVGFTAVKEKLREEGVDFVRQLPFMGPVTSYHLAKNLGLDVAKPDRHLTRVAKVAGYECPAAMCTDIAAAVGERISVVDLVIWRYATIRPDYLSTFAGASA